MKILLITDEVWNDDINGNNILTNWFDGFDAQIYNIYCSPGRPKNKCCENYFQITDSMMAKSLLGKGKAGIQFKYDYENGQDVSQGQQSDKEKKFYRFMKSITTESIRAVREFLWLYGSYDENKLKSFVEDAKPDIIFSPRYASRKILRLERIVHKYAKVPIVAFTADDEYTLAQFRISPIYWIRRLLLRKDLRKNMKLYSKYYMFSEEQMDFYKKEFGIDAECLYKVGDFSDKYIDKSVNTPIRMVYAGKLYCNRWKVLRDIGRVLERINKDEVKIVLNIYTKDSISRSIQTNLHDERNIFLNDGVSVEELNEIYRLSDIALHVESSDIKNRLLTRYSFSTKIIDCLASSCAVVAVCWSGQSGYKYLQKQDAALCFDNMDKLYHELKEMTLNDDLLKAYQEKAWKCGKEYHNRVMEQKRLKEDFEYIIEKNNS